MHYHVILIFLDCIILIYTKTTSKSITNVPESMKLIRLMDGGDSYINTIYLHTHSHTCNYPC